MMNQISQLPRLAILLATFSLMVLAQPAGQVISQRFKQITRASNWQLIKSIPLNFKTYHPQGLVKIGNIFYVSSVEVKIPTRRFTMPQNDLDRDAGAGLGHLFKFDEKGTLLADLPLGEGTIYHPGGIDYDGQFIWVPVAEYRPNSRSIIYRVTPENMQAREIFRYPDHLGGIVHRTDDQTLHGMSWGSRFFYRWPLDRRGRPVNSSVRPNQLRQRNPSFYIDYQDCKYLAQGEMLCGGLSTYQQRQDNVKFSLGGLELIDLSRHRAIHQVPVELWTTSGLPMTQNPFWIEPSDQGLRVYFLPEDEKSTLYIYEVITQK